MRMSIDNLFHFELGQVAHQGPKTDADYYTSASCSCLVAASWLSLEPVPKATEGPISADFRPSGGLNWVKSGLSLARA